jgi:hypothetical protein
MIAFLLLNQAFVEGAEFFQLPVAGFLSRSGSMVSPAAPVSKVPLAESQISFPLAEPVPHLVMDVSKDAATDPSVPVAAPLLVCALAFAGVAMRKPLVKANRKMRAAAPVMMDSGELICGPADQVFRHRSMAYVVMFNAGRSNEGVYTLEKQVGGSVAQLLTFENTEDAGHFVQQLRREGFNVVGSQGSVSLDARAFMWDARKIAQFCQSSYFEVALVPSGEKLSPPQKNEYDPARFGERHAAPEDRFQSRPEMMGQAPEDRFQSRPDMMGQSMWNPASRFEQRRRAHDILRNTNMTGNQKRGQSVWDAAMRRMHPDNQLSPEMCGAEECGLDTHMGDRHLFEKAYGAEMCGAEECGLDKHLSDRDLFERLFFYRNGPGPDGPNGPAGPDGPDGTDGPAGRRPWGFGPDGRPGWSN